MCISMLNTYCIWIFMNVNDKIICRIFFDLKNKWQIYLITVFSFLFIYSFRQIVKGRWLIITNNRNFGKKTRNNYYQWCLPKFLRISRVNCNARTLIVLVVTEQKFLHNKNSKRNIALKICGILLLRVGRILCWYQA